MRIITAIRIVLGGWWLGMLLLPTVAGCQDPASGPSRRSGFPVDAASATPDGGPPSSCGNGVLEGGETCDDGNLVSGDGCSATCVVEGRCLITSGGGIPVRVHVTPIVTTGDEDEIGLLGTPRMIRVDGEHTVNPGHRPDPDRFVTICRGHAYVGALPSATIARVDLDPEGNPVPGPSWSHPGLASMACDEASGRLQVLGVSLEPLSLAVVEYAIGATGDLTPLPPLLLDPPLLNPLANATECMLPLLHWTAKIRSHPVTGELWLLTAHGCEALTSEGIAAWRMGRNAQGALAVAEEPVWISRSIGFQTFGFTAEGSRLLVVGYGAALGWTDLLPSGRLPEPDPMRVRSGEAIWENQTGLVVSGRDEPLYVSFEGEGESTQSYVGAIRIGADGAEPLAVAMVPGRRPDLLRVPGMDLLVTVGSDGEVATLRASADGARLEVVDTLTLPEVYRGRMGAVMPCAAR